MTKMPVLHRRGGSVRLVALMVLLILAAVLPLGLVSPYIVSLVTLALIWGLFAMSLDPLAGYAGLTSFGHAAYLATAAYAAGILMSRYDWNWLAAALAALGICLVLALVLGSVLSHLKGVQYSIVTFAFAQMVWGLANQWHSMTNGDSGVGGIGRPVIGSVELVDGGSFYYFVLAVVLACGALLTVFVKSPFGLSMRAIKQTESRMRVVGYNVWLHKYVTYVVAALFASVAGVLFVWFNGFVSPTDADLLISAKALLMVLAGGPASLFGPVLGAFAVVGFETGISAFTDRWVIGMGILYMVVVVFLPGGLLGLVRSLTRGRSRESDGKPADTLADESETIKAIG